MLTTSAIAAPTPTTIEAPTGVPVRGDTLPSCRWNGKALSLAIE